MTPKNSTTHLSTYLINHLTALKWVSTIWPRLVGKRLQGADCPARCYVIDGFVIEDWTQMLDELDSFRDIWAAMRIGPDISGLLESRAGLGRATILADAADRYGERWGLDKISEIKCWRQVMDDIAAKHEFETA